MKKCMYVRTYVLYYMIGALGEKSNHAKMQVRSAVRAVQRSAVACPPP